MAAMLPASVFGLRVPAGGIPIPSTLQFPASFRITMAAIDPHAEAQLDDTYKVPRATLKIIRDLSAEDDDSDDDFEDSDDDIEAIKARLAGVISDDDEDMSDEDDEDDSSDEKNGGPSDPARARKAKQAALTKRLQEQLDADEMELDQLANGINGAKAKGKAKALEDDMGSDDEPEEFVVCTLDPEKQYQQPLDITVGEHEQVYFQVNGTHDIYLTGNYVLPPDMSEDEDEDDYDSDDFDLDLPLDEDEDDLDEVAESDEDELDGLRDPRITEIDSDDEQAPKLVDQRTEAAVKRGKNKRPAESFEDDEEATTLDELISKNKNIGRDTSKTNGEEKHAKKLKNNNGQAVAAAQESARKETSGSDKKKVQFAKNLEQGPTGSPKVEDGKKGETKKETSKTGPRNVQGVTVDEKKIGQGRTAKKGDRIEMRYIGKLKNGKQFDANKKGKPFSFKLGTGEVIKGWDIGVAGMAAGGERRLTIPAKLGYGSRGAPPDIPPNSELVFDIKCISVS